MFLTFYNLSDLFVNREIKDSDEILSHLFIRWRNISGAIIILRKLSE